MSRVPKSAADCKSNPASNNNAASAANASRGVSKGSRVKLTRTPLFFSWDLALKINPKQPDVLASLLIYGLYTWKPKFVGRFSYAPTINGEYACYRSTRELEKDYTLPCGKLATDTAIEKALKRASKRLKECFIVKDDVPTADRGKLHYLVSDKLAKAYKFDLKKENGLTKFYLEDAIRYKSILAAVLLANMDYQIAEFAGALKDEDGNKYGELSPAKLTSKNKDGKIILPKHREVVGDAIRALKRAGAIIEHPARNGFYRRNTDEVEVGSDAVEVGRREVEVGRRFTEMNCNVMNKSMLQRFPKTSDSNTDSGTDRKCLEQNKLTPLVVLNEASLPSNNGKKEMTHELIGHEKVSHEVIAHEELGHKKITDDVFSHGVFNHEKITHEQITHSLMTPDIDGVARHVGCNIGTPAKILMEAIKNAPLNNIYAFHPLTPTSPHAVYEVLDYDKVEFIGYETHYDFIPLDWNTGRPYSRAAEIIYTMEDLKRDIAAWRWAKPSAVELDELRQLFIAHRLLTYDHIAELMAWCEPRVEPLYIGNWKAPKKGHDSLYWARRIRSLKAFLKYLPQIIKEWWRGTNEERWNENIDENGRDRGWYWLGQGRESGELVEYKYYGLTEPLLSIAYSKEPLLLKHYQTYQDRQEVSREAPGRITEE